MQTQRQEGTPNDQDLFRKKMTFMRYKKVCYMYSASRKWFKGNKGAERFV